MPLTQVLNEEEARHELAEELQRKEEVVSNQEMKINNLTAEVRTYHPPFHASLAFYS